MPCGLYVVLRDTFNCANKGNIQGFISAINTKFYVMCNTGYVRRCSPQQCWILRIISDTFGDASVQVRTRAYWGNPCFRTLRGQRFYLLLP
jgi:hypothetical protein